MKSLYESIMDVDDNIENMDSNLLIGGHYYIDINGIKCSYLKDIFKIGLIKMKQPREIIKGPVINSFDDPKENKMVETLCTFILNLPLQCLDEKYQQELSIIADYRKFQRGVCYLGSTIGGTKYFITNAKTKKTYLDKDNKSYTYVTPSIYIPLHKK